MREVEIVAWASLNSEKEIEKIIRKYDERQTSRFFHQNEIATTPEEAAILHHKRENIVNDIRNHILNTAQYTKLEFSGERSKNAIKEFFQVYFENIVSKHTDWEILYEPIDVTPQVLCQTRKNLIRIYREEIYKEDLADQQKSENIMHQDLNKVVELLSTQDGSKPKQGRRKKQPVVLAPKK